MKKILFLTLGLLLFTVSANTLMAQTESKLLIKSSFNHNVIVDKTVSWNHHLAGTDTVTNFTFPDDLPGDVKEHYFNYVVGDMEHYDKYANAEIVTTEGYDGNSTTALYIEFIKDDPNFVSYSRVQYAMYGDESSNDPVQRMNKGYVKYRIKTHFDPNDSVDWRLPIEWKDMDDDGFRMGLYVYDPNTDSPYWVAKGQYMIDGELGDDIWEFDNYNIPVLKDEWFELEVYWYANPDTNLGKFRAAINGQVLFDITARTKDPEQPNKMFYFMPFKVYGTVGYSWITDFEYWDSPPENSVLYEDQLKTALVGHWTFDDPLDLTKAEVGSDLSLRGDAVQNAVPGYDESDGAVAVGAGSYYYCEHQIEQVQGENKINEYTLVYDVRSFDNAKYHSLLQVDTTNSNDGDFFIAPGGRLGVDNIGYTRPEILTDSIWYRIGISVKAGTKITYYVNGDSVFDGNSQTIDDCRVSLGSSAMLLFADGSEDDVLLEVSDVKLFSKALNSEQMKELGGIDIPTAVRNDVQHNVIQELQLYANYPNPFNPTTIIKFSLPCASVVRLSVYNALGQEVRVLINKNMRSGSYSIPFDGSSLASGIYFYKLESNNHIKVNKMLLLK